MSFGQGGPNWDPREPQQTPTGWGSAQQTPGTGQGPHQGQSPGQLPGQAPSGPTPDWAALAEASEARARRRRWLMIGGGALATVVVASVVAFAVVSANSDTEANKPSGELPASETLPSNTASPDPSFPEAAPPPPPDPKDYISSAKKDKAPLSPDSLFPGTQYTKGESVYKKGKAARTKECDSATKGALGSVLTKNNCEQVIRTTYRKDGLAVTVGVAVFETDKVATKAKDQVGKGNIQPLAGAGVPEFCKTAVCRTTANAYGRYAYFTVTGHTDGKDVTGKDEKAVAAGNDIAELAFRQIHRRGEAQASAAAGFSQ
ncbi:hypothetical protein DSC45_01100 [Streptomyces sp. YIM 130001]|uniref:hypothetical protein n=1 Tax=Streptomyces sp. YIM 130001 TaxID=2259644 RepID=UPI000E65B5A6|nr:hypothetical protein [Streptomyces sp. YIM 130001]RII20986.1 hypothetical protein DSC45_01100 [Streptomyces sp. YIM 130001]